MIFEVSPERRDYIINRVAEEVVKRHLEVPMMMFVEMHKPIANIAGQGAHYFAPFAGALLGNDLLDEVGFILEDKQNLDRLLERMEILTAERDEKERLERQQAQLVEELADGAKTPSRGPWWAFWRRR